MYTGLLHLHSALRWVVVLLLILTIFKALVGRRGESPFASLKKFALPALIVTHLQLVIGLVMYFAGDWYTLLGNSGVMKVRAMRFFALEHLVLMVIAIALITIGYSSAKRMTNPGRQYRRILVFYLIGFVIMMASIPWPFMADFADRSWF